MNFHRVKKEILKSVQEVAFINFYDRASFLQTIEEKLIISGYALDEEGNLMKEAKDLYEECEWMICSPLFESEDYHY